MAASLSSALLRARTDRRLADLAAQGSEPAFEALVEPYRPAPRLLPAAAARPRAPDPDDASTGCSASSRPDDGDTSSGPSGDEPGD